MGQDHTDDRQELMTFRLGLLRMAAAVEHSESPSRPLFMGGAAHLRDLVQRYGTRPGDAEAVGSGAA
ncbi:MAG: hypothetical protein IPM24_03465 [Bryobacterales bacterium]|nr:hypothetical protein [Bryobacterales bacterium]